MNLKRLSGSLIAAIATMICLIGMTSPANAAGTFDVEYCHFGDGGTASISDWRPATNYGQDNGDDAVANCGQGDGSFGVRWTKPSDRPNFKWQKWLLDAGSNLAITKTTFWASAVLSDPSGGTHATWPGYDCYSGANTLCGPGAITENYDRVKQVGIGLDCRIGGANWCYSVAQVEAYRAVVTFEDDYFPVGSAEGSMFSASVDDPASGQQVVALSATDSGAGVKRFELQVDGRVIARTSDQCTPPFDKQSPCPRRLGEKLPINTRELADGLHSVVAVAIDAAGNSSTIRASSFVVRNTKDIGPPSPPELRGAGNGSPAADGAQLSAVWPATKRPASRRKHIVRRCKKASYRSKHKTLCYGRAASNRVRYTFSTTRTATLRGMLKARDGSPVAGARIGVTRAPVGSGMTPQALGYVTTRADGSWEIKVPLRTGSSDILLNYSSHERDTVPSATASARLNVAAATTMRIRRNMKAGKKYKIRGELLGTSGNAAGTQVQVQLRYRGKWSVIGNGVAGPDRKWAFAYRWPKGLSLPSSRTRARVTPSAGYNYAPAKVLGGRIRVGRR